MADENENDLSLENKADEGSVNLTPVVDADAATALDALAQQIQDAEKPVEETPAAAEPKADDKPAAEPKADEADPNKPATEVKPVAEEKPASPKEDFETVELPAHSRPKTSEAFTLVKEKARVVVEGLRKEIETGKTTVADLNTQLEAAKRSQGQLTPEIQSELEDLRKFKLSHDVESDPSFKQFANDIDSNRAAVLKKLTENGANEETIAKINEIGFENVDWDKFLGSIKNVAAKRYIESKLVENEGLKEKKAIALEKAKTNAKDFIAERDGRQSKVLNDSANAYVAKFNIGAQKEIPANATPEQKTQIEAENAASKQHSDLVQSMLAKYSPEAYAETVVGTALAYRYAADNKALIAARADDAKKIESVTKERDALQKKLDGIKQASAVRRPGEIRPAAPPAKTGITEDGASALDRLAKEIQSEQNDQ